MTKVLTNHSKPDERGRDLRQTLEHTALEQLIEAFRNEEIDAGRICKLFQAYCEFKKQDASEDKNRTSVQVARLRYANARSCSAVSADRQDSLTAPYGTKPTGEPYTRTEFLCTIRRTVRDLYGIDLDPEPAELPAKSTEPCHGHGPDSSSAPPNLTTLDTRPP